MVIRSVGMAALMIFTDIKRKKKRSHFVIRELVLFNAKLPDMSALLRIFMYTGRNYDFNFAKL